MCHTIPKSVITLILIISMLLPNAAFAREMTADFREPTLEEMAQGKSQYEKSQIELQKKINKEQPRLLKAKRNVRSPKQENLKWELDTTGTLTITGSGMVNSIKSAEEQPWRAVREKIKRVHFDEYSDMVIESTSFYFQDLPNVTEIWFTDCSSNIGTDTIKNCPKLKQLHFHYFVEIPAIEKNAFNTESEDISKSNALEIYVGMNTSKDAREAVSNYDWKSTGNGRAISSLFAENDLPEDPFASVFKYYPGGTDYCPYCKSYQSHGKEIVSHGDQYADYKHKTYHWCNGPCFNKTVNTGTSQFGTVGPGHVKDQLQYRGPSEPHNYGGSDTCSICNHRCSHRDKRSPVYSQYSGSRRGELHWVDKQCKACGFHNEYTEYHSWRESYSQYNSSYHRHKKYCIDCNYSAINELESHTFSGNTCIDCGYTKPACTHSRTRNGNYYDGCYYDVYCADCGIYLRTVTNHGPYSDYDPWEYYNTSQHYRKEHCIYHYSVYQYGYENHNKTRKYENISDNDVQHKTYEYCPDCGSIIGSKVYENHNYDSTYWESSATNHFRVNTCQDCGHQEFESHPHNFKNGSWKSISETEHQRTNICSDCDRQATETEKHHFTVGNWNSISTTEHQRTKTCNDCNKQITETAHHQDKDGDGKCDDCGAELSFFSATVPATLQVAVGKDGKVSTSTKAAIANRSNGNIEVRNITYNTQNGWKLAPFKMNMSDQKVDSKLIGFSLNGEETTKSSNSENMNISTSEWQIPENQILPLHYDSHVSATSKGINDQAMTITFVLDWSSVKHK